MRFVATLSLGAMIDAGIGCRAMCDICPAYRDIDLPALAVTMGLDADLWGKRTACRLTESCPGKNRFYSDGRGRFEPMRD